jgi:hypothetical protein
MPPTVGGEVDPVAAATPQWRRRGVTGARRSPPSARRSPPSLAGASTVCAPALCISISCPHTRAARSIRTTFEAAGSSSVAECRLCSDEKVANRDGRDFGWDRSRGRFAALADFPRHDLRPYSHVHVRREYLRQTLAFAIRIFVRIALAAARASAERGVAAPQWRVISG